MDSQTLALISGLQGNWQETFQTSSPLSLSIQSTDNWNPTRQLGTDRTTAETVGLMASHAVRASSSPVVLGVIRSLGIENRKEFKDKLSSIFLYIKKHVKFVEDNEPLGRMFGIADSKELLITPPALLSMRNPKGDCDDFSMLAASMMIACGIPCSFVTVAADQRAPDTFTHVYCMGAGIPFDASHGKEVGWETEKQFRKQVWPIFVGNFGEEMGGLGMIVGKSDYKKAWFNAGLRGLLGLGDCSYVYDDDGNIIDCVDNLPTNITSIVPSSAPLATSTITTIPSNSSAATINWNNLLPGIFGSAEKIAQQTTQQPGYQTVGPNGQMTSVVLPAGATSIPSIPGLSSSSLSSMLPFLLIAGIGIFALSAMNKG